MLRWLIGFLHGAATVTCYFLAFFTGHIEWLIPAVIGTIFFAFGLLHTAIEGWDD